MPLHFLSVRVLTNRGEGKLLNRGRVNQLGFRRENQSAQAVPALPAAARATREASMRFRLAHVKN
jgi:hypothetical protein